MPTPSNFSPHANGISPLPFPSTCRRKPSPGLDPLRPDARSLSKHRTNFRLFVALQLCAVRLYGRFSPGSMRSLRTLSIMWAIADLPPSLALDVPERKATYTDHRQQILTYLGFQKFDDTAHTQLTTWLHQQAQQGLLPGALFPQAEQYLLEHRLLLPGPSVLERLIISVCADVHAEVFEAMFQRLSPRCARPLTHLPTVPDGEQRSAFASLKDYPPAATISSMQAYLRRYHLVCTTALRRVTCRWSRPHSSPTSEVSQTL